MHLGACRSWHGAGWPREVGKGELCIQCRGGGWGGEGAKPQGHSFPALPGRSSPEALQVPQPFDGEISALPLHVGTAAWLWARPKAVCIAAEPAIDGSIDEPEAPAPQLGLLR